MMIVFMFWYQLIRYKSIINSINSTVYQVLGTRFA